jgi:ABC-type Co2+ transport system permease subunit
MGNWVFALCGVYGLQAQFIDTGSGATITPLSPSSTGGIISPVYVTSSHFTSATSWSGANTEGQTILATDEIKIFWDDAQIFLEEGTQWTRTALGADILIPGFDATANDYNFYIFISRP